MHILVLTRGVIETCNMLCPRNCREACVIDESNGVNWQFFIFSRVCVRIFHASLFGVCENVFSPTHAARDLIS